jgi:hypothetical protein
VIATSYKVLQAAQCSATGLLPNWVVPDPIEPASGAKISHECREKSPAPEFGVEAAKVAWRVFLDYAWFTEPQAAATLKPLTLHAADKVRVRVRLRLRLRLRVRLRLRLRLRLRVHAADKVGPTLTPTSTMTLPLGLTVALTLALTLTLALSLTLALTLTSCTTWTTAAPR